jgi:hypothetical protein
MCREWNPVGARRYWGYSACFRFLVRGRYRDSWRHRGVRVDAVSPDWPMAETLG